MVESQITVFFLPPQNQIKLRNIPSINLRIQRKSMVPIWTQFMIVPFNYVTYVPYSKDTAKYQSVHHG